MPPLPNRLFVDNETVGKMASRVGGKAFPAANNQLLALELPGKRIYSISYVQQALSANRVLSVQNIQRFNLAPAGKQAIAAAKEEFESRLRNYTPYSDPRHPKLVTVRLLEATLFTDSGVILTWCRNGQIPHTVMDDTIYFDPDDLLRHFQWSQ